MWRNLCHRGRNKQTIGGAKSGAGSAARPRTWLHVLDLPRLNVCCGGSPGPGTQVATPQMADHLRASAPCRFVDTGTRHIR